MCAAAIRDMAREEDEVFAEIRPMRRIAVEMSGIAAMMAVGVLLGTLVRDFFVAVLIAVLAIAIFYGVLAMTGAWGAYGRAMQRTKDR